MTVAIQDAGTQTVLEVQTLPTMLHDWCDLRPYLTAMPPSPRQFDHVPFVALVRPRGFDRALRFNYYDIAANPSAVP